jgi:hypothetical protein
MSALGFRTDHPPSPRQYQILGYSTWTNASQDTSRKDCMSRSTVYLAHIYFMPAGLDGVNVSPTIHLDDADLTKVTRENEKKVVRQLDGSEKFPKRLRQITIAAFILLHSQFEQRAFCYRIYVITSVLVLLQAVQL